MTDNLTDSIKDESPSNISTEIFIKNWSIYRKIIENNNMSHREGYNKLKDILTQEMKSPFSFLDIACGDAYYSSKILKDTNAQKYTGIDVSDQALSLARKEFKDSRIEATFINADFRDLDQILDIEQDIIWIGFSLHHLDTLNKLQFMQATKDYLTDSGILLIYEPIFIPGEDRADYFKRFQKVFDEHWSGLTQEEGDSLLEHVRETEIPETTENWIKLGFEAGFSTADKVFSEKTGLYEILMYRK